MRSLSHYARTLHAPVVYDAIRVLKLLHNLQRVGKVRRAHVRRVFQEDRDPLVGLGLRGEDERTSRPELDVFFLAKGYGRGKALVREVTSWLSACLGDASICRPTGSYPPHHEGPDSSEARTARQRRESPKI